MPMLALMTMAATISRRMRLIPLLPMPLARKAQLAA